MAKYQVIRPWYGVKAGEVVDLKEPIHPSLKANVVKLGGESTKLVPATPSASTGNKKPTKAEIAKRLKELGIDFDGRKSAEELAELLPDGDPLKAAIE